MSHDRGCWKCGADTMGEKAKCAMAKRNECAKFGVFFRQDAVKHHMPGVARLYCDMDGVLADFNAHHRAIFGKDRERHSGGWEEIRETAPTFYRDMPAMPDMPLLWQAIAPLLPIILTGSPPSIAVASNHKIDWKNAHPLLGERTPIICCRTRDKALYCRPGDLIIDDNEDRADIERWEKAGGVWVLHKDAASTILKLQALGVLPC
jgi:hypothetical protein